MLPAIILTLTLTLRCGHVSHAWPFQHGPLSTQEGRTLETEAGDLSDRLTRLTAHLQSQTSQITDLAAQLGKWTQFVSFTVTLSGRGVEGTEGERVIKFDRVLFNAGSGYSPDTGVFTAPRTGLYAFHLTVTRHPKDPDNCVAVDLIHTTPKQLKNDLDGLIYSSEKQPKNGLPDHGPEKQPNSGFDKLLSAADKQPRNNFNQIHSLDENQSKNKLDSVEEDEKRLKSSHLDTIHNGEKRPKSSHVDLMHRGVKQFTNVLDMALMRGPEKQPQHRRPKTSGLFLHHQHSRSHDYTSQHQTIVTVSACLHDNESASSRAVVSMRQGGTVHALLTSGNMLLGNEMTSLSGMRLAVLTPV